MDTYVGNSKNPATRKIMVVDKDVDSLKIVMEPLRWEGYDVLGVSNIKEAVRLLESWRPHIVIMDWISPSETGLKFLRRVKQKLVNVSCLFVSADSRTEAIIQGLDAGADDYIIKPFVPLELLARVRTQIRIRDLNEQLLYANEKLKELVDIDDLTGLFNMRSLYQKLEFEIERGRRFGRDVCVIMLDMDKFKSVNDGHDHLFGSFVISEIGKIIKANTRNIDIPARYGGDEFLIVLTEVNFDGAMLFCERLRKAVEKTTFQSGNDSIRLTVSVGFAMTQSKEIISPKELVRRADHALYQAKRQGRNRTICWNIEQKSYEHFSEDKQVVNISSNASKRKKAG